MEALLKVYRKFQALVSTAFDGDQRFPLEKAARRFINSNAVTSATSSSRSPELVARFTDQVLRKSNRTDDSQNIEQVLDDAVRTRYNYLCSFLLFVVGVALLLVACSFDACSDGRIPIH